MADADATQIARVVVTEEAAPFAVATQIARVVIYEFTCTTVVPPPPPPPPEPPPPGCPTSIDPAAAEGDGCETYMDPDSV